MFGRQLPQWFGRQGMAPPVDPSLMAMLPQVPGQQPPPQMPQQPPPEFTQMTPAGQPAQALPVGPGREDVMQQRALADSLAGGGLPLQSVSDPWTAGAYALNKGLSGWAEGRAKKSEAELGKSDRKALIDALNQADPMSALATLDNPEAQNAFIQMKLGQMNQKPSETWQDVDTDGDKIPDAQRNSVTQEYKPIDKQLTFAQREQLARAGASRTNVTVSGGEKAFEKGVGEWQAKAFGEMATEGLNAKGDLANVGTLRNSLAKLPGGWRTGLQGYASSVGIKVGPNASALELADSVIARLVPTQRAPGSGQMSDRDVTLFKDSLPKLMNTPEGNSLVLDTMEGMARFKQEQGKIATAAMTGQMNRQQATEALMNLPDPMAKFKASVATGGLKEKKVKEYKYNPATGMVE